MTTPRSGHFREDACQITGLETAQKNAKDGISLVQTAEGALTEVHDMLNRMVELADQSANGTYDNQTDRDNLQKEFDQLTKEINRIADSSTSTASTCWTAPCRRALLWILIHED